MNSLVKAYYMFYRIDLNLTSNMIPDNFPFKLNTKFFKYIIPGIYDKYPNQELNMMLKVKNQPFLKFNNDSQSIEFSAVAFIQFSLIDSPKNSIFSFNSDLFMDLNLGVNNSDSSVHFTANKLLIQNMTIVNSEFPDLDIDQLKTNLNYTFQIISRAANLFYLNKGIPIPIIKGLKIKKVIVKVEDDFFIITIQPDVKSSNFDWFKIYN